MGTKVDEKLEKINTLLMSGYPDEFLVKLETYGITEKALKTSFLEFRKKLLAMKQKCLMSA